jgi:hypothetical protein
MRGLFGFGHSPNALCLKENCTICDIFPRIAGNKKPLADTRQGFCSKSLAMTYSHMGKPHTTIGDASFHF